MLFDLNKLRGIFGDQPQGQDPMFGAPQGADKVSPWRVLDGVLGGNTISGAMDAERARQAQAGFRNEIAGAFQGPAPQAQPGLIFQPRAEESNGIFQRTLAPEPQMNPGPGAKPAMVNRMPSFEDVAPIFGRAEAAGVDTSGVRGLFGDVREERAAGKPKVYQTDRGLIERDPTTGKVSSIYDEPPKVQPAPAGYRWNAGKLEAIPGGPADLTVIGGRANTQRQAVVNHPMPTRARAPAAGSSAPWKRTW